MIEEKRAARFKFPLAKASSRQPERFIPDKKRGSLARMSERISAEPISGA